MLCGSVWMNAIAEMQQVDHRLPPLERKQIGKVAGFPLWVSLGIVAKIRPRFHQTKI
jgi:hypothetical protein